MRFGKAREAKELWKEGVSIGEKYNRAPARIMVDLVGTSYTLVLETTYKDLGSYELALKSTLGAEEWEAWYKKFVPLCESGRREVFTVVH